MEVELRKLLEPVIKDFIAKLLELENKQVELNKDLASEIERLKQEQNDLKIQRAENDHQLSLAKDKLAEQRLIQDNLNSNIKNEIARYSELSKEYGQKIKDIEQNLKDSIVEKELVAEALARANKEADNFKAKTNSLADDFAKLNNLKNELAEKAKYLLAKEKAINKQETEVTIKANQLNDIDLRLKAREVEVNRLIKRYELEKFIKEGAK
jgi:chromosome segregation ATPase